MTINLIIVGVVVFVLAYLSKRRFGLLGLALVAGTIVSSNWAASVNSMLQAQGVSLSFPPLSIVVAGFLIALPALLLLLVGTTYHKKWQRIIGSALFAGFLVCFIAATIYRQAPALADSNLFALAANLQSALLLLLVVLSLADIIVHHLPKKQKAAHK